MSGLQDIPITVVHKVAEQVTDNVQALLAEIATSLDELIKQQKSNAIDLRSLPLLPGELEALKTILGEGEINVNFDNLGNSQVYETALGGVWWIRHQDENANTIAELIEVTQIPEILRSQPEDIAAAHTALKEELEDWNIKQN